MNNIDVVNVMSINYKLRYAFNLYLSSEINYNIPIKKLTLLKIK